MITNQSYQQLTKIVDAISSEHLEFLAYCADSGKIYVSDLTSMDYVAFRTRYGKSKEYVRELRLEMQNGIRKSEEMSLGTSCATKEVDNLSLIKKDFVQRREAKPVPKRFGVKSTVKTLAEHFKVNPSNFSAISIDVLDLSARPKNCLMRSHCKSLEELLWKSEGDLQNIHNMGNKSKMEIIQAVREYVSDHNGTAYVETNYDWMDNDSITLTPPLKDVIEALLRNEPYDIDCLSESQKADFMKIKNAVNEIGMKMCRMMYDNPHYNVRICNMLWSFSSRFARYEKIEQKISYLSKHIQRLPVLPFIEAYEKKTKADISWLISQCSMETQIQNLSGLLSRRNDSENCSSNFNTLDKFLDWMSFDIIETANTIWQKFLDGIKSERERAVFLMRAEGKTLEEIGREFNVTRERVRQIEKKTFRLFWRQYNNQDHDVVMMVQALNKGKDTISFKDLQEMVDDFAFVLWECLKHEPEHSDYYYSKMMDMIVVRRENERNLNDNALMKLKLKFQAEMPPTIEVSQKEDILYDFMKSNTMPSAGSSALLEQLFESQYKKSGNFYHKGRITATYMCEYVLKNRFQNGFKIADDFEADRFRQYMGEFFGSNISNMTNRALDAVISKVGILCDRGKYVHPDFVQVESYVIDAINRYIENSDRSVLPYGEIYEELQEVFLGTQVTNRYLLQGILKKYGCDYRTDRDNVKKNESATFVDELDAFVEEFGIVHKSQIFAEFKSLGEAVLGQIISRSPNVFNIDQGYYIHVSQFDIQPEDYEPIRKYLQEACRDVPVTIVAVYNDSMSKFPDFINRNDFNDRSRLFAALQYMFQTEFRFSRPYIGKLEEESITSKSVLLHYLEEYDSIEVEELVDMCDENSIYYVSINYLIQTLAPEYIRVGVSTLMKKDLTDVTDDVLDSTVEMVQEMIGANGYVASTKITDFLWFPQISVDWNEFLLESIIELSHKIPIIYRLGNRFGHANAIYVSEEYKNDNFESFLIKLLEKEVRKGSFTSKNDMADWLREEGLIVKKLPNFLESAKYFCIDSTGVHRTESRS